MVPNNLIITLFIVDLNCIDCRSAAFDAHCIVSTGLSQVGHALPIGAALRRSRRRQPAPSPRPNLLTVTLQASKETYLLSHNRIDNKFVSYGATWRTWRNIRLIFNSGLFAKLCENMTLSTKPEA